MVYISVIITHILHITNYAGPSVWAAIHFLMFIFGQIAIDWSLCPILTLRSTHVTIVRRTREIGDIYTTMVLWSLL